MKVKRNIVDQGVRIWLGVRICPGRRAGRPVAPISALWKALAMLSAYFDASATEVQDGVSAIGGYVAPFPLRATGAPMDQGVSTMGPSAIPPC